MHGYASVNERSKITGVVLRGFHSEVAGLGLQLRGSSHDTASDVSTKAQAYFTALYTNPDAKSVVVSASYTASSTLGSTILVSGSGQVTADFMKVAGFPTLNFNTSSTAAWGNVRMRVAMALDNTGSMSSDGEMPALKTVAKSLVDQLSALAKNPGDVYISIVPFSKDVNVGSSNYGQNWIDWTDWEAEPVDLQDSKPSIWSKVGPGSDCPLLNEKRWLHLPERPGNYVGRDRHSVKRQNLSGSRQVFQLQLCISLPHQRLLHERRNLNLRQRQHRHVRQLHRLRYYLQLQRQRQGLQATYLQPCLDA